MNNKNASSIEIYLSDCSSNLLNSGFDFDKKLSMLKNIEIKSNENKMPINELFCQSIGFVGVDLPWNQLRALQFDLAQNISNENNRLTLACCDPVMMQVTHRGAYLWGQDTMSFSNKEVIAIVAQINDKLMEDGESFYLLNNKQWLYVNEKKLELQQASFENEIGRDQFGFSYSGNDRIFWNRLATEIQMLIKQMIDYGDLNSIADESLVNVHFWGDSNNQLNSPINIECSGDIKLYANNNLIKTMCAKAKVEFEKLGKLSDLFRQDRKKNIMISFSEDSCWLEEVVDEILSLSWTQKRQQRRIKLVLQDRTIELRLKQSFLQRLFND
jgi:hypothetical protein